ncbi:vWA domain-containing protein [Nocardia sp. NPDC050175]|uniref:vWA domain-containing protein n=1 Tax=Nocardia sp. NPDC050175 TaxID=3364317 RepID=UPI0037AB753C
MAFRELVGPTVNRRRWPRAVAVAVFLGCVLLGGFPAHAQPSDTSSAVVDYGACLLGQQRGDLLLLLDESGSLGGPNGSDPHAARVLAAKRLLDKLAEWTDNTQVSLDISIAGFAQAYDTRHDWVTLNDKSLPELKATIDGEAGRTQGVDTNYGVALSESLRNLTEHRPDPNPAACRAIAWFTDGELDFGTPDKDVEKQRIDTTRDSICVPGGIADQVRATGVRTFALGLGGLRSSGDGQPPKPPDFGLLESIATGKPLFDGTPCGDIRTPRPGEFFTADNIDELIAGFAKLVPQPPIIDSRRMICSGQVQDDCKHKFVLDNSIRAVNVEANGGAPGLTATLIAPDATAVEIPGANEGTVAIGGISVNYRWNSASDLSFKMANAPGTAWRGVWALAFVDKDRKLPATQSKSSITIYGNLVPTWTEPSNRILHAAEKTRLRLGISDRAGKPVDPATIEGSAELSATIIEQSGAQHELAKALPREHINDPLAVDLTDIRPGPATLRLSLAITTAASGDQPGTLLHPEPLDIPLQIAPPAGFPEPGALDFGTLAGSGEFTAVLPVRGEGCVWVAPTRQPVFKTRPDGIGALALTNTAPTDAQGCVPGAQARSIPVVLRIENQTNGLVSGTIPVTAARANEINSAITIDVPFRAKVEKKPDISRFWIVLILTIVLGPGIPLLLLYLMKWITARIPGQILKAQQFPVRVTNGVLLRDGARFALRDTDLVDSVSGLHHSTRKIDLGGVILRARTGWAPAGRGYVTAHASGMVGASSVEPRTNARGNAVLPLSLQGTWFVLHDPDGPADHATLVLLLGGGSSPAQRAGLATDASNNVPGLITELRSRGASGGGRSASRNSAAEQPPDPVDPFASRYTNPSASGGNGNDPFSSDRGSPSSHYRGGGDADPFTR